MNTLSKAVYFTLFSVVVMIETTTRFIKWVTPHVKEFITYVKENAPYWQIQLKDWWVDVKPQVIVILSVALTGLTYVKDYAIKVYNNREVIRETIGAQFVYRNA